MDDNQTASDALTRRYLIWAFLGATLVRLISVLFIGSDEVYDNYLGIARQLVAGHGYVADEGLGPNLRRPPIYPGFLAALIFVVGDNHHVLLSLQALLSAATVVLVGLLGQRLVSARVGKIAIWLWALYPLSVWYGTILASETVFTFLLASLLYVITPLFEGAKGWSWKRIFLAGLIMGALALTRPSAQAYPILFAGLFVFTFRNVRAFVAATAIVVTTILVILPWTFRNHSVTGKWIPVGIGVGQSSYEGLYLGPKTVGGPNLFRWDHDEDREKHRWECLYKLNRLGGREAVEYDQGLRKKVVEKISNDPLGTLGWAGVRFLAAFFLNNSPTPGRQALLILLQLPWLVLASLSLFRVWREKRWWPSLMLFFFAWMLCVMVISRIRLTYPAMMVIMILAATTIARKTRLFAKESGQIS